MKRTGNSVTRFELCEAVYQKVGRLSRTDSSALVELVLKEITECLERGETAKLASFGSFIVRKKSQRVGRNPKTGVKVQIARRRVIVFKPSLNARSTGSPPARRSHSRSLTPRGGTLSRLTKRIVTCLKSPVRR
jgi:integration host factor subunit alpha